MQKEPIVRDQEYLDWLKTQRCLITGRYGTEWESVDPAHIGTLGKGIKRGDDEVLPVLHRFHHHGHGSGEISMFREQLPDAILRLALRAYARELYREYLTQSHSNSK